MRPIRRRTYWRRRTVALLGVLALLVAAAIVVRPAVQRATRGYSNAHGMRVDSYTLDSRLLGRKLEEIAIVPPGGGRRPLLVLLHGRNDRKPSLGWLGIDESGPHGMLSQALVDAVAKLGPRAPVVALLNGDGHSYFHDRRDGPWASMMLREAIPQAERRFHTLPGKVAIGGISMGGYGALHLASLRPHEFCAVGGHSAAVWTSGGLTPAGAFDDAEDFNRNDVIAAARAGRLSHQPVWIDGGNRDPFRDADTELASVIRAHGGDVVRHIWPGAHEGAYWHAHMAAYLRWYARELARCNPRP